MHSQGRLAPERRTTAAAALVGGALVALFLIPAPYFVAGTFAVMLLMIVAAYWSGGYSRVHRPSAKQVALGAGSALLLYAVFYGGNAIIHSVQFLGFGAAEQASIYSLISSPSNPVGVQLAVLAFDAVGYESFFRGVLQNRLTPRLGVGAAFAVALFDAGLHVATLNPLWVVTTFVADAVWGLTYYYGRGLPTSLTSHFLWDVAIFVLRPIA